MMKTPQEKYTNDPLYYQLVNMLELFIEKAEFTPSELREAAVLACIRYEQRHFCSVVIDKKIEEAFDVLEGYARTPTFTQEKI